MSFPRRFQDDGTTVTVDLHGCTVRDGLYIARRCVQEAFRRGRSKVEVIHGSSTSRGSDHERTIKSRLMQELEAGGLSEWASGHVTDPAGGRTTIWIMFGANANPARMRAADVLPR